VLLAVGELIIELGHTLPTAQVDHGHAVTLALTVDVGEQCASGRFSRVTKRLPARIARAASGVARWHRSAGAPGDDRRAQRGETRRRRMAGGDLNTANRGNRGTWWQQRAAHRGRCHGTPAAAFAGRAARKGSFTGVHRSADFLGAARVR